MLSPLDLDRHSSRSSLLYRSSSTLLMVYARSLDLLEMCGAITRKPRYINVEVTNEKPRCSRDIKVVITRMLVLMT